MYRMGLDTKICSIFSLQRKRTSAFIVEDETAYRLAVRISVMDLYRTRIQFCAWNCYYLIQGQNWLWLLISLVCVDHLEHCLNCQNEGV